MTPPTRVAQTHEVERLVDRWVNALSHRERDVIEGRFGLHGRETQTLEFLSDSLGLTRERVRQIQNEALLKLKRYMFQQGLGRQALL